MKTMKGYDAFEHSLKKAMETYEVPYNSADWAQLEEKLDHGNGSYWQNTVGLTALLMGGVLAVATTTYMLLNQPGPDDGRMAIALVTEADETLLPEGPTIAITPMEVPVPVADADERTPQEDDAEEAERPAAPAVVKAEPMQVAPSKERPPVHLTTTSKAGDDRTDASAELTIKPSITEGCPGTTVEFAVNNLPEGGIHLWNFGDGSFSNQPTPKHTFSKAGTYEVMLSHSSLGGGNIHNKPVSDRIIIHDSPEASFNLLKREFDNTVPSVHFENRSIGGKNFVWDFGDGSTSTIPHPNHVYKRKGTYTVMLTVINAMGCADRTERTVRIDSDYDLMAPKTFSPNGDGVEDSFIPEALRTLGVQFHLSIFDQSSGRVIYETRDASRPWNGRMGNKGEYCTAGDYVWMVEMKDGDKLGGTYNGTVSLLR